MESTRWFCVVSNVAPSNANSASEWLHCVFVCMCVIEFCGKQLPVCLSVCALRDDCLDCCMHVSGLLLLLLCRSGERSAPPCYYVGCCVVALLWCCSVRVAERERGTLARDGKMNELDLNRSQYCYRAVSDRWKLMTAFPCLVRGSTCVSEGSKRPHESELIWIGRRRSWQFSKSCTSFVECETRLKLSDLFCALAACCCCFQHLSRSLLRRCCSQRRTSAVTTFGRHRREIEHDRQITYYIIYYYILLMNKLLLLLILSSNSLSLLSLSPDRLL